MTDLSGTEWFANPGLKRVLGLLNAEGGEGRVVGGAVRNSLMGMPVADIDIATTLLPQDVMARAAASGVKSVPTGVDHGTVTLVVDGKGFEVTTLRRDIATDGRHAQVAFGTDWQADAERRDLTINALYVDGAGQVIDLVGGMADIEARKIRFIGEASQRIAEDYLRVLRFFRFFAWYGEGRPDADGLRASARAREKLGQLSAERVWAEMKKLLAAPDPGRALLWMRQAGILTEILPETEKWGIDSIPGLVSTEKALGWAPDPLLRLAAIVPPDAARLAALGTRLRLSNAEMAFLEHFAMAPSVPDEIKDAAFDRLLYGVDRKGMIARLKLALVSARSAAEVGDAKAMAKSARVADLLAHAERFQKPVFPIGGADVLAAGVAAGPKVGQFLKQLEQEWVERNFALDRAKLIARLKVLAES